MAYQNPYMSYQGQYPQAQQPVHGFVYVTGIDGARAFQLPPNSEMPLFDSTSDGVMFIKTTDAAGFPTIVTVDCKRRESQPESTRGYVTHEEFERMVSEMKESIYAAVSEATAKQQQPTGVPANGPEGPTGSL